MLSYQLLPAVNLTLISIGKDLVKCNALLYTANMGFLIVQTHETPAVIVNLIKGLDYEYFVIIKD